MQAVHPLQPPYSAALCLPAQALVLVPLALPTWEPVEDTRLDMSGLRVLFAVQRGRLCLDAPWTAG